MAQHKFSRLDFQDQPPTVRPRARARADVPAPEITLGFSDSEAPTALVPKPLLNQLLRDTLSRDSEGSPTAPSVPDDGPTVIVVPVAAEETQRVQRRKGKGHVPRPSPAASARVAALALLVALVLAAVVWRSEVAGVLRVLAHAVGISVA